MAHTVSEFLQLDLVNKEDHRICAHCHKPIQSQDGIERRFINSERVHEDCYFEALGRLTEQHPVGIPIVRS